MKDTKAPRIHLSLDFISFDCKIILTIKEARNLASDLSKDNAPRLRAPNPYVNCFLHPESASLSSKFKTQILKSTEDPVFIEHFAFSIDHRIASNQRLHVAMWDWAGERHPPTFIGCLSFSVTEIMKSERIDSWFLLLPKEAGIQMYVPYGHEESFHFNLGSSDTDEDNSLNIQSAYFEKEEHEEEHEEELSSTEIKRQEAIYHYIKSEEIFTQELTTYIQIFVDPLNYDLTSKQHAAIFANMEQVHNIASAYLDTLVERQAQHEDYVHFIGDVIKRHVETIRAPYLVYCVNKQNAILEMKRLVDSGPSFLQFLSTQADLYNGADINNCLRAPLLHLVKAHDLIKEILDYTPSSHPDYYHIQDAYDLVAALCDSIQTEVAKIDGLAKMAFYEEHLVYPSGVANKFKLSLPGRKLVLEGPLLLTNAQKLKLFIKPKEKILPVHCLVFTDVMIIAQKIDAQKIDSLEGNFLVLCGAIALEDVSVSGTPTAIFNMTYKKEIFSFEALSLEEKVLWTKVISEPRKLGQGSLLDVRKRQASISETRMSFRKPVEIIIPLASISSSSSINSLPRLGAGDGAHELGFSLRPDAPSFIKHVTEGSPAYMNGLRAIHQLREINGTSVVSLTHEGIVELIQRCKERETALRLLVVPALHAASLICDPVLGHGFELRGVNPPYIRQVAVGGPAEKAGLKLGDQLWEVNGEAVRHRSHSEALKMIQAAGHTIKLLVRPTMRRVFIPHTKGGLGFTLSQIGNQPVFVSAILPSSSAKNNGLSVGDQLWEVNRKDVRSMSLPHVEALLKGIQSDLVLLVIATLREVELHVDQTGRYGFTLQGNAPVRIASVENDTPSSAAGLRPSDIIWEVNDTPVLEMTHNEVVDLIRRVKGKVKFLVSLA